MGGFLQKRIGLDDFLKNLGFTDRDVKLAELLIVTYLVTPLSQWANLHLVKHQNAIDGLLDLNLSKLPHNKLYRISDQLLVHKEWLEKGLVVRERSIFDLQEKIVLYYLININFESSRTCKIKRRGKYFYHNNKINFK